MGTTPVKQQKVRTTLTFREIGGTDVIRTKEIETVIGDYEIFNLEIQPETGRVFVTSTTGGSGSAVLTLPFTLPFVVAFPHNGMTLVGNEYLNVDPAITPILVRMTDDGNDLMQVHAVDVRVTFRGLIDEKVPSFDKLAWFQLRIETVATPATAAAAA